MDKLHDIVKEVVESMGYYLYEMTFNKRDGDYVLAVEIEHKNPISIDDCVRVSAQLSKRLDEDDPIEQAYMLEVSSAGAEHPLRNTAEMERAISKFVHINTGDNTYEGTLVSVNEEALDLLDKKLKKTITIQRSDIKKIRLAVDF